MSPAKKNDSKDVAAKAAAPRKKCCRKKTVEEVTPETVSEKKQAKTSAQKTPSAAKSVKTPAVTVSAKETKDKSVNKTTPTKESASSHTPSKDSAKSPKKAAVVAPEKASAKTVAKKKTANKEESVKNTVQEVSVTASETIPASSKGSVKSVSPKAKPAPQAPVSAMTSKEDILYRQQLEAIAKTQAELAANPDWAPFVAMQRQHLMDLRDQFIDSMNGASRDTLRSHPEGSEASGSGEHQADAGSDAYDRELALGLLSKAQDGLYEIEQALARIENGTYGICEMSYKPIPILRLEAIPYTRFTVECQAIWEKEKGTMTRTRPRSVLGFAGGQNESDSTVSLDEDEE